MVKIQIEKRTCHSPGNLRSGLAFAGLIEEKRARSRPLTEIRDDPNSTRIHNYEKQDLPDQWHLYRELGFLSSANAANAQNAEFASSFPACNSLRIRFSRQPACASNPVSRN